MNYQFSDKLSSLKPSAIREIFKNLTDPSVISFAAGNPSPESFPVKELESLAKEIFETASTEALQYSMTEGYAPLRKAIEERLAKKFNIGKDFDETIIVSGGQQGIELACKAFCNDGDVVLCETPTFIGALNAFRSNGAKTVGVDCDDFGIIPEILEKKLAATKNVKLLYVIPTFQNPSGITTPLERRKRVYELCKKYGVIILEDNPYGELRFSGEEIPTIKSFDDDGLVIYCSSFSKILSAGMRVGYVTSHKDIISKMVVAKQSEDVHTNIFFQILCYKYISKCDIDTHIKGICKLYKKKCDLMLSCLEKELPSSVKFTRPEGGLFILCTLPGGIDSTDFVKKLSLRKLAVVPGSTFLAEEGNISSSFRLNYSTPSDENIIRGCEILGSFTKEYLAEKGLYNA